MPYQTETLITPDHYPLLLRKWLPDHPKAIILLAHGMTEHSLRYQEFGKFLMANGIGLYCHDQRAHGEAALAQKTLGHLPQQRGWLVMADDLGQITTMIQSEFTSPLFLMGHSMGSYLARWVIQTTNLSYQGLILSGTGGDPGPAGRGALVLAKLSCLLWGEERSARRLQKINFGQFNNHFKPTRTDFDWLCSDPAVVDNYSADPLCGFTCTNGFFSELYDHVLKVNKPHSDKGIDPHLPIYLLSGDQDPVGGMGRGVKAVYQHYLEDQVRDVTLKLYPGDRHELLNEPNKLVVAQELVSWIERVLN